MTKQIETLSIHSSNLKEETKVKADNILAPKPPKVETFVSPVKSENRPMLIEDTLPKTQQSESD